MSWVESPFASRSLHAVMRGCFLVALFFVVGGVFSAPSSADEKPVSEDAAAEVEGEGHGDHEHGDSGHSHEGDDAGHGDADHGGSGHEDSGHGDEASMPPLLQFDFGSAVCNLAIFLGVLAILSKFVWPVILDGLKAREDKIHGDLVAAEKASADAKALLQDYQSQLSEASTQVQTLLADARKDAEASGQRIVDEAKAEAERQRERAVSDIQTAKKVALAELAGQTSDMAMAVAGQVVGRELKADDHAELIRQSLERLPSKN